MSSPFSDAAFLTQHSRYNTSRETRNVKALKTDCNDEEFKSGAGDITTIYICWHRLQLCAKVQRFGQMVTLHRMSVVTKIIRDHKDHEYSY